MKSIIIFGLLLGIAAAFAVPIDINITSSYESVLSLSNNEDNITDYIEVVEKSLIKDESNLKYFKDVVSGILKKDLTEIQTKVYENLQNLLQNAISKVKLAETEIQTLKSEKGVLIDFLKEIYKKLRNLRNEIWEIGKIEGLLESDVLEIEKIRQKAREIVSDTRLKILAVEGKFDNYDYRKSMALFKVTLLGYSCIGSARRFFKDTLDQKEDFFKQELTEVENVVFKALFRLFAFCFKNAQKAMLEFEDVEYDVNGMSSVLNWVLEKIENFERDFVELSKTEGLPQRDVDFFNQFLKGCVKEAEKRVGNLIELLKTL